MTLYFAVAFGAFIGGYYSGATIQDAAIRGLAWIYYATVFIWQRVSNFYRTLP